MKRFLLGLLFALTLALAGGAAHTSAAGGPPPGGPRPGDGPSGKITAIDGTTITVQNRDGTVKLVTSASTTFQLDGKAARLSDIKVGMFAHAEGSKGADHTFIATRVLARTEAPVGPPPRR
jgi:hypothetical protein